MITPVTMRALIRELYRKGANEEEIEAVITALETESNCQQMLEELSRVDNPSREWLLGTAILIADPN